MKGLINALKRLSLFVIIATSVLLLYACEQRDTSHGEQTNSPNTQVQDDVRIVLPSSNPPPNQPETDLPTVSPEPDVLEPLHLFRDEAVKEAVERYFNKSADELAAEDLFELSKLKMFAIESYGRKIDTFDDMPILFPELRYVKLVSLKHDAGKPDETDYKVLEEMAELRAIDIYTDWLPSLDFFHELPYVSIVYTPEMAMSDDNNLAEASVLGRQFVESHIAGNVSEYVKVADGDRVYELIVARGWGNEEWTDSLGVRPARDFLLSDVKVFISEYRDEEYHFLESLEVFGRSGNISGGLIIADVNFDGHKDILVPQGHFGAQGTVHYACYLSVGGTYALNESFSKIANPSLDFQNRKILSTWRNMAVSHSWAMYSYINGEFVETDRLTSAPEIIGDMSEDGLGYKIEVWNYTSEHYSDGSVESEIHLTSDYTDDEWIALFYDESSFWGLSTDKWRTLYNQGTLLDWSIYGSGVDYQIMEIISD